MLQLLKVQLQTKLAEGIYFFGRLGLAGLFLWSGLSKGYEPGAFAETIAAFGLLPGALIYPAAIFLIVAELAVGLGLLIDQKGALAGSTLLMLLFMAVLGYGIYLGLDIDCGCFGPNDPEAQAFHNLRGSFIRDLLLLLVIFYLYLWRFVNWSKSWTGDGGRQIIAEEA